MSSVRCMWPSQKVDMVMKNDKAADSITKATGHGASEAARTRKNCFGHLVSTPWLLCFLIVVYSLRTSRPDDDKAQARKASDLIREWVIRAAPEPMALIVLSSSGKWILQDGKIMSDDDHDLRCLLFSGGEGPHYDVLDWLFELSLLLTQPGHRASDRARRKASELAASLMTNLAHRHDAEWQSLCPSLLADMATAHGADTHKEVQKLYEAMVLLNRHFVKKGPPHGAQWAGDGTRATFRADGMRMMPDGHNSCSSRRVFVSHFQFAFPASRVCVFVSHTSWR